MNDLVAEQVERLQAHLRTAAEMASAFRFEEAIALLAPVGKQDHPRLAEHAARARELSGRLAAEQQRQRIAAKEAHEHARQCLAAFDYDGAAEFLESVPLPLQDEEMRQLLTQVAERRQEIDGLSQELRSAVRERRLLELPSRIELLLALKPDHAYGKSVAAHVQKEFLASAKKMLAGHRYDQALRLLDQISGWADASDYRQLRRQAAESAWLAWDLRHAPVVDDTLVAVAERLRQLAPDDAPTIRLCNELQRRTRLAKGGQHQPPIQWARPPEQTPLGVPVEWLTGFRRVTYAEAFDPSSLLLYPGRFAIACGLALAGIRQAPLRINLLSAQQRGMVRRVKSLLRRNTARSAWGIDIGTSTLKAIKLAWNVGEQRAAIEAAVLIEHAKVLNHAVNQAEEEKLVSETLKEFLERQEVTTERVCVSLPGRMVMSRQIELPPLELAKVSKVVQFEAPNHFRFPLEQLAWDFQLLEDPPDFDCGPEAAGQKGCRALLIAAKRATTQCLVDGFQRLEMPVDVLQPDFVALHNFLVFDYLAVPGSPSSSEAYPVVLALDIGCDATNIVVSSRNSLWFRSCGVAGHGFTRAMVREFNLSIAQAEQRKRRPESAERLSDLYEALSPVFDDLLKEVQQSLATYAEARPDRPVQRVVGLGGGFCLHGLFRYLRCGR